MVPSSIVPSSATPNVLPQDTPQGFSKAPQGLSQLPPGYQIESMPSSQQASSGPMSIVPGQPQQGLSQLPEGYTIEPSFADKHPYVNEVGRVIGITTRALAPYGAGAGIGALMTPEAPPIGALAGAGVVGASKLYDALAGAGNYYSGSNLPIVTNYTDKAADAVGLPTRDSYSMPERYYSTGVDTVANVASGAGLGKTLLANAPYGIGKALSTNVGKNVVAGLGAGAASQTAGELGVENPALQLGAGILGAKGTSVMGKMFVPHTESVVPRMQTDVRDEYAPQNIKLIEAYQQDQADAAKLGVNVPKSLTGTIAKGSKWQDIQTDRAGEQAISNRKVENNVVLGKGVSDAVRPEGDPYGGTQAIQGTNDATLTNSEADLEKARGTAGDANAALQDAQSTTTDMSPQLGANASSALLDEREANYKVAKDSVSKDYGRVDQTKPVSFQKLSDGIDGILHSASVTEAEGSRVPSIIGEIQSELAKGQKLGMNGGPVGKLISWQRLLGDDMHKAILEGSANQARMLGEAQDFVRQNLTEAEGVNDQLKEANSNYKSKVADVFLNDTQGRVQSGLQSGRIQPSEFVRKSLTSVEGARQFKQTVNYDTNPLSKQNVRDYWMNNLAERGSNKSNPTFESVSRFSKDNSDLLHEFPDVKGEIDRYALKLKNGSDQAEAMNQELVARRAALEDTKTEIDNSAPTQFKNNPTNTMGDILDQAVKDPRGAKAKLQQIVDAVNNDPTGKSAQAVKDALKAHLSNSSEIKNLGSASFKAGDKVSSDILGVSFAKMNKLLLPGGGQRAVLESVFTPKEMSTLDQYHKAMLTEYGNQNAGVHGSPTQPNEAKASAGATVGKIAAKGVTTHLLGTPGRIAGHVIEYLSKTSSGDDTPMMNKLKTDALLEPNLAKALMTDPKSPSGVGAAKVIQDWQDKNNNQGFARKAARAVTKNAPTNSTQTTIGVMSSAEQKKGEKNVSQ